MAFRSKRPPGNSPLPPACASRFTKVLVANRGEIAVRIIQACQELGISTVAVYSEADRHALHVRLADEAYPLGPTPPAESYLHADRVLKAARESGAQAIHPGYGFLSENADFAEACLAEGLVFIGPPPEAIRLAGDKIAARRVAASAGVPVVPGYDGDIQDDRRLEMEAAQIGFPLVIKAAAGGGGRGMRTLPSAGELGDALASARREARAAFGDDRLFLERLLSPARHVEFQVLADGYGKVVHLFERECSIQRRYQKILEESPSPALTPELRMEMARAAVRITRAVGYVNAGSVEFLLTPSGDFYFLEMNTRLQVEHPVTEMVTGLDLVRLQLEIAAGGRIPFDQADIASRGHAIEARIYAEDPDAGFLPSAGKLVVFEPPRGVGIRHDLGVEPGWEVGPAYDPLLAKLVAYGADRPSAMQRLAWALRRYAVLGVATNIPFLLEIVQHEDFLDGKTYVDFIPSRLDPQKQPASNPWGHGDIPPAALLGAVANDLTRGARSGSAALGPWLAGQWRSAGCPTELRYRWRGGEHVVWATRTGGDRWIIQTGNRTWDVTFSPAGPHSFTLRHGERTETVWAAETDKGLEVFAEGRRFVFQRATVSNWDHQTTTGQDNHQTAGLVAPLTGVVVRLLVREGDRLRPLDTVAVLEAMKMEHTVQAPHGGIVRRVHFREGDLVPGGATLVEIGEG